VRDVGRRARAVVRGEFSVCRFAIPVAAVTDRGHGSGQIHRQHLRGERRRASREVRRHEARAAALGGDERGGASRRRLGPGGIFFPRTRANRAPTRPPRDGGHRAALRAPVCRAPALRLPHREPASRVRREEVLAAARKGDARDAPRVGRHGCSLPGGYFPHRNPAPVLRPGHEQAPVGGPRARVVRKWFRIDAITRSDASGRETAEERPKKTTCATRRGISRLVGFSRRRDRAYERRDRDADVFGAGDYGVGERKESRDPRGSKRVLCSDG
jgi:hypothetical protein